MLGGNTGTALEKREMIFIYKMSEIIENKSSKITDNVDSFPFKKGTPLKIKTIFSSSVEITISL